MVTMNCVVAIFADRKNNSIMCLQTIVIVYAQVFACNVFLDAEKENMDCTDIIENASIETFFR